MTAKWVSPISMPTSEVASGNDSSGVCTTKEAKYRPAASLITVTDDGSDGRERDQTTDTSPILGSRRFPFAVIAKRAFLVNRIVCRESFFDRNRGGPTLGPLRSPVREAKKLR